jgi:hypothetical protein
MFPSIDVVEIGHSIIRMHEYSSVVPEHRPGITSPTAMFSGIARASRACDSSPMLEKIGTTREEETDKAVKCDMAAFCTA